MSGYTRPVNTTNFEHDVTFIGIDRRFCCVVQRHFVEVGLPLMRHTDAMNESVLEDIHCVGFSIMGTQAGQTAV